MLKLRTTRLKKTLMKQNKNEVLLWWHCFENVVLYKLELPRVNKLFLVSSSATLTRMIQTSTVTTNELITLT